jgi:hypothetical protein
MVKLVYKDEQNFRLDCIPPKKLNINLVNLLLTLAVGFCSLSILIWLHAKTSPLDPINISMGLFIGCIGWITVVTLLILVLKKYDIRR